MGSDRGEIPRFLYDTVCSTWNIIAWDSSVRKGLHYTYSGRRVSVRNRLCKRNPRVIEDGLMRVKGELGRIGEDWGELEREGTSTPIFHSFFHNQNQILFNKSNHRPRNFTHSISIEIKSSAQDFRFRIESNSVVLSEQNRVLMRDLMYFDGT